MVDQREHDAVRHTVGRVEGYWSRAGVPKATRRQRAEELRSHLLEAVDAGRTIEDVVGDDVAAFASEWAEAERSRPLLDLTLQLVAALTLVPGGFALLLPVFGEQEAVGLPGSVLGVLPVALAFYTGWHLIRLRRHWLTTQHTALLGVVLFVSYMVLFTLVQSRWDVSDEFVTMSPIAAGALVLLGAAAQGSAMWTKRSPRW